MLCKTQADDFLSLGMKSKHNIAILLVAVGASGLRASEDYCYIGEKVKKAHPDLEVRWAFSAQKGRLAMEQSGIKADSPAYALNQLAESGFTRIAVQPLYVIPGDEFARLQATVADIKRQLQGDINIVLGEPLLGQSKDVDTFASALISQFVEGNALDKTQEGVLLVGHGTKNSLAVQAYASLNTFFQTRGAFVYALMLQDEETFSNALHWLGEMNLKSARLVPLMTVAGKHVLIDIAGEHGSLACAFEENGIKTTVQPDGLARNEAALSIWLSSLSAALGLLKEV